MWPEGKLAPAVIGQSAGAIAERAGLSDRAARTARVLLVAESGGDFAGCVFVDASPPTGYFGLLSVARTLQQGGLGSHLVAAAEERCRVAGCSAITIRVVNLRTELPPFYRARGYEQAGIEAFESSNTSMPCHFIVMSKLL